MAAKKVDTTVLTVPCEAWLRASSTSNTGVCGKPAREMRLDEMDRMKALCPFHASIERRSRWARDFRPVTEADIEARRVREAEQAEVAKKAREIRAAEAAKAHRRFVETLRAEADTEVAYGVKTEEMYGGTRRMHVVRVPGSREYDRIADVRVEPYEADDLSVKMIAAHMSSRITPKAARAIAAALLAAADEAEA
jgi:hypothetical protein